MVPPVDTHAKGRPTDQLHGGRPARPSDAHSGHRRRPTAHRRVAEVENPNCHIAWTTLAGIGQVKAITARTTTRRCFPTATCDRHQGRGASTEPMAPCASSTARRAGWTARGHRAGDGADELIPQTREYGVDANNDGVISVDNIDDAALSAAGICVGAGRISPPREGGSLRCGLERLDVYARAVRDWATAYAAGHRLRRRL